MMNMLRIFSLLSLFGILILVIQENGVYGGPYMGCYKDEFRRAMPNGVINLKGQTIETCVAMCLRNKFKYAGLQAGTYCFCADNDSYAKYGKAPSSECNVRCGGNKAQFCGGGWKNSVYATVVSEPCNGLHYENKCLTLIIPDGTKPSFPRAHNICRHMNQTLAEISSNDMYDKTYTYVRNELMKAKKNLKFADVSLGMTFEPGYNVGNLVTLGNGKKIQLKQWCTFYSYPYKGLRYINYTHMLMRVNIRTYATNRGLLNVYSNWQAYPLCERKM